MKGSVVRKRIQLIIGLLVGAVLLWWLFRDTKWDQVFDAMRNANWAWLGLTLIVVLFSFVVRIWRWRFIVGVAESVTFMRLFNATQIGFLGNFVLPARLGEPIRALVLSRSTSIPFSRGLAYVALDRLTDMVGLAIVLLFTVLTFHPAGAIYLPGELRSLYADPVSDHLIRNTALSADVALVALLAMLVLSYVLREPITRTTRDLLGLFSPKLGDKAAGMVMHFTEGMAVMRSFGSMMMAVLMSVFLWGLFVLSHWTLFRAMHLNLSWYAPFVTVSLLAVFISVPGPPGFVGPFHAAIICGLLLLDPVINIEVARATAILAHLSNLVPVVAVGVWCLSTEKMSLGQLQRESEALAAKGTAHTG